MGRGHPGGGRRNWVWAQDGQVTRTLRRLSKGAALVEGCELAWGVGPESDRWGSLKRSDCEGCGDVEPGVWGVESRQIELCECGCLKLVEELRSPREGPIRGMSKHLRGRHLYMVLSHSASLPSGLQFSIWGHLKNPSIRFLGCL